MPINHAINCLLEFAVQKELMKEEDVFYAANRLIDLLRVPEFVPEEIVEEEMPPTAQPILDEMLEHAIEANIIEGTQEERDLFDTRLMDCVMPRPSAVNRNWQRDYARSPKAATDRFYKFSQASNYIRQDRIKKNIVWSAPSAYGDLDITINLSKPEKDPRDIAKAKNAPQKGYPKCLLCRENEGYAGHIGYPARETHRLIPIRLSGHRWFFQYSPYTYYNEHCIVLNRRHVPMKVSRRTFENLLDFVTILPHYFVGSNADLPIVGGSILSHDHYQGGRYEFPMAKAAVEKGYRIAGYPDILVGRLKWPMAAIRLRAAYDERDQLVELATKILETWRDYSDEAAGILAASPDGTPHNTVTAIARRRGSDYELDIVLRNNRTTDEYPLGIFHPHAELHHIKKENIGLIEVMGLAVLPGRLKQEMEELKAAWLKNTQDIADIPSIAAHADWYRQIKKAHPEAGKGNLDQILRFEIAKVFEQVLEQAGVYKRTPEGTEAFERFMQALMQ